MFALVIKIEMKNIHILKTDKPSRLVLETVNNNLFLTTTKDFGTKIMQFQNIYITSDEEIKEEDWCIDDRNALNKIINVSDNGYLMFENGNSVKDINCKKIILTTDQSLDGVQAIDDEFLEWFVKNPSCEEVEVIKEYKDGYGCWYKYQDDFFSDHFKPFAIRYKIIIPKEEPKQKSLVEKMIPLQLKYNLDMMKQETLEEAAENYVRNEPDATLKLISKYSFKDGAKWQQERMYSEEEVLKLLIKFSDDRTFLKKYVAIQWFEQNKKK